MRVVLTIIVSGLLSMVGTASAALPELIDQNIETIRFLPS